MATAAEKSEYPDVEELVAIEETMTHSDLSSTNDDIDDLEDQTVKKPSEETMTPSDLSSTNEEIYYFKDQAVKKPSCEHKIVRTQLQNPRMKHLLQLIKNKKPRITHLLMALLVIAPVLLAKCVSQEDLNRLNTLLNSFMSEFHPIKTAIETAAACVNNLAEQKQLQSIIKYFIDIPFQNPVSMEMVKKEGLQYHSNIMKLNDKTMEFFNTDFKKVTCSTCGS